jgi:hypothetical protein
MNVKRTAPPPRERPHGGYVRGQGGVKDPPKTWGRSRGGGATEGDPPWQARPHANEGRQ